MIDKRLGIKVGRMEGRNGQASIFLRLWDRSSLICPALRDPKVVIED